MKNKNKNKEKEPVFVYSCPLGLTVVDVYGRPGDGGDVDHWVEDTKTRINVGFDRKDWASVFAVFLHEVDERLMCEMGVRYHKTNTFADSSAAVYFFYDHVTFTEIKARQAEFIIDVMPKLKRTWEKWQKNTK